MMKVSGSFEQGDERRVCLLLVLSEVQTITTVLFELECRLFPRERNHRDFVLDLNAVL
jgi:hypothetical protein